LFEHQIKKRGLASAVFKSLKLNMSRLTLSRILNLADDLRMTLRSMTMSGEIDRSRLIFPALGGLYGAFSPYAYAFMRFSAGAILVPHGWQKLINGTAAGTAKALAAKGFPFAMELAYFTGFLELVGAACLAIGLFTRFFAAALWIQMLVIIIYFVGPNGYFWGKLGYEFALLWLLLYTAIFFRGGGRYSVDYYLGKEL